MQQPKNKTEIRDNLIGKIILTSVILICIALTIYEIDYGLKQKRGSQLGVDFDCSGMGLSHTAYCLEDYVESIFIYNSTDDLKRLTLEELKERGGDCKDYTDFYEEWFNYYGYKIKRIEISIERDEWGIDRGHEFLVAYNEKGYCEVDMTTIRCHHYSDE